MIMSKEKITAPDIVAKMLQSLFDIQVATDIAIKQLQAKVLKLEIKVEVPEEEIKWM